MDVPFCYRDYTTRDIAGNSIEAAAQQLAMGALPESLVQVVVTVAGNKETSPEFGKMVHVTFLQAQR